MTFTTALLALISLTSPDALALKPAKDVSAADVKTIKDLLAKANSIQVDVDIAKNTLDASVLALKKSPNDPVLTSQVAYDGKILESIVRERDLVRIKAIHRTLTAYGIVAVDGLSGKPMMPSGTSVSLDYKGQAAHWRVVAGDDQKHINVNAGGDRIHEGPTNNPDSRASTDGWGITVVYEKAFSSPEYLALILSHEKEHFEQYTTKGRGDKFSTNELDVEAWAKTEKDALILGFGANDPVTKAASRTRAAYEKAVADEKWRQKWSLGLLKPKGIAQATLRTPSDVADIGRRFDDLSEIVALEIKTAREEAARQREADDYRRRVEEARRQGESVRPIELRPSIPGGSSPEDFRAVPTQPGGNGAVALNPSQPPISELQLKDIAARACAAPPQPVDRQLSAVDWRLFQTTPGVDRYADGLSGCEQRVVLRLIALGLGWRPGAVIGADEVRAAAAGSAGGGGSIPPDPNHGRVWDKIGPIIRR